MDSWWTCSSVHSAHPLEEGVKEMLTRGQPWDQPSGRRLLQTGHFPAPLSVGADSAVILFFGELSCGPPGAPFTRTLASRSPDPQKLGFGI